MTTIEIKEDFQLSGTDIILETGDMIKLSEAPADAIVRQLISRYGAERVLYKLINDWAHSKLYASAMLDYLERFTL